MSVTSQYAVETSCVRPMKKTTGSHKFTIMGHSLDKDKPNCEFLESTIFNVSGYDWCISYYPTGCSDAADGYVSIFLSLRSKAKNVKAQFSFTILDLSGNEIISSIPSIDFKDVGAGWGYKSFAQRAFLDSKIKDDCFIIKCVITVCKSLPVEPTPQIVVPPGTFQLQVGHLLESGTGADVTFDVNGVTFSAHKCILAARSPVFLAQFFGLMKEKSDTIKIKEMETPVFKSLLHFIYHDSFPSFEELKEPEEEQDAQHLMTQRLLIAADRYDLERLKIMCEKVLADSIDKSNVGGFLALADRHSCNYLKKSCFNFLVSTDY